MASFDRDHRTKVFAIAAENDESHYLSVIADHNELAAVLSEEIWGNTEVQELSRSSFGPLTCLTFDVPLEIEVPGYLQPAVNSLAEAGISIVPQCALIYDHIMVETEAAKKAIEVLTNLKKSAEQPTKPSSEITT